MRGARSRRRALAGLLLALAAGVANAAPQRIASLNLCADSLLLELVEPARLVSLTKLARDPNLSNFAAEASRIPANHGLAEEILPLHPDLVLTTTDSASAAPALLARLGLEVMTLETPTDFAGWRRTLRTLAQRLGAEARAAALIAEFDARLARLAPAATPRRAIVYQANGYVPGPSTFADDMLRGAGLVDAYAVAGHPEGGFLPLEHLITLAPDVLVVSNAYAEHPALANTLLDHPALAGRRAPGRPGFRYVAIPERLWTCGSSRLAEAVERLAAAR